MRAAILVAACALAAAQARDSAYEPLARAYAALQAHDYDTAVAGFTRAIELAPQRVGEIFADGRAAAAAVSRVERIGPKLVVESAHGVGVPWRGPAVVDGQPWPVRDAGTVWLPAGAHSIEAATAESGPRLVRLNGELKAARSLDAHSIEFTYQSSAPAIAVLDRTPRAVEIDSVPAMLKSAGPNTLLLPRGQHIVTLTIE